MSNDVISPLEFTNCNNDNTYKILIHKDLIHSIVDALEINLAVDRTLALTHHRSMDDNLLESLNLMRSFENKMIGSDVNYAKISFRI